MRIKIGLGGIKLTAVPPEDELSKDRVYYVYEWFIKDSQKVFYVGKGKGDRYKQDKNYYFKKVKENFDCDVRFIKTNLTEYESLLLEEEWIAKRAQEGHVLTNIVTPNALGAFEKPEEFTYMQTPKISISRVDREYFGVKDVSYDKINLETLLKTHIYRTSCAGLGKLYSNSNKEFIPQEECEKIINELITKVVQYIEGKGGRVYKSRAKSVRSIINYGVMTYETYLHFKEKGYDVYHLIDVLKFIEEN